MERRMRRGGFFTRAARSRTRPPGLSAGRVLRELATLVNSRRSVMVFTKTRAGRGVVRVCACEAALPRLADRIEIHHGSLDRNVRLEVEDRLKNGELRAVVCSSSLEMGVDIGAIDLVILISAPKGISRTLQRIGRSGHSVNATSHGILVATNVGGPDRVRRHGPDGARAAARRRCACRRIPPTCWRSTSWGMALEDCRAPGRGNRRGKRCAPRGRTGGWNARISTGWWNTWRAAGRSLAKAYADTFGKLSVVEDGQLCSRRRAGSGGTTSSTSAPSPVEGLVDVLLKRRRLGTLDEGFVQGPEAGGRVRVGRAGGAPARSGLAGGESGGGGRRAAQRAEVVGGPDPADQRAGRQKSRACARRWTTCSMGRAEF